MWGRPGQVREDDRGGTFRKQMSHEQERNQVVLDQRHTAEPTRWELCAVGKWVGYLYEPLGEQALPAATYLGLQLV